MIFELHQPKNVESGKKYPALFVMHGMGSNEKNMWPLVEGLEDSFYIFSMRGSLSLGSGYAFFTIKEFGNPHREIFDETIKQITNFIDYASKTFPVDLNNLYLLGFSQGAILSMSLGLTLGNKIKGIVALSGYIPRFVKEEYDIKPGEHLSVFVSHGDMDQVLPYQWGKENVAYFEEQGIPVVFKTYHTVHTVTQENLQDFQAWIKEDLKQQ